MNKVIIGLFVLLNACTKLPDTPDKIDVKIIGRIVDGDANASLELLDAFSHPVASLGVSSDFVLDVEVDGSSYFVLKYGNTKIPLYLSKDYALGIEFNAGSIFETLDYTGRGRESNQYLVDFELFERSNKPAYDQLLSKTEDDFLVEARRYRVKSEAFLNSYLTSHVNLDPKFISKERSRILYAWANRLIHYPEAHIYYTGGDDFVVSDTYHDYKKTVNLDELDLITLPEYQTFIKSYVDAEAEILRRKGDKRNFELVRFDLANQLISEQEVKDFVMHDIVTTALQFGLTDDGHSLAQRFLKICQNAVMRTEVKSLIQQWNNLASGKFAPAIQGRTDDGKEIDLEDFQGKFLYLAFWASWCLPCSSDQKGMEDIMTIYNAEELSVISVSIDESPSRPGASTIPLLMPKIEDIENIRRDFMIHRLPRYVLIDSNGRIVDANAPGPSDPALKAILASYALAFN